MIEGTVNAAREAIIPIRIQGPDGRALEIETVVDTGYDGYLILPATVVAELDLHFAYASKAILANDAEVDFDVHHATILWDGQPRNIEADAAGSSTPLMGMLLLDGHSLNVEVKDGGRVVIQAMP